MDSQKVISVVQGIHARLLQWEVAPKRYPVGEHVHLVIDGDRGPLGHIVWMCEEMLTWPIEERLEKSMRWLGFIQAVLWTCGIFTVKELKEMNLP